MSSRSLPPFFIFLLTGGLAAAVNIGVRLLLSLAMRFEIAVTLSYLVAMSFAYLLARIFVFERSGQSVRHEFSKFAAVNIVALVQVWLVSVGLANWLFPMIGLVFYPELVAHVVGVLSPVATSYYGHKYFTFKKK
jgi:putative flippase GtrA